MHNFMVTIFVSFILLSSFSFALTIEQENIINQLANSTGIDNYTLIGLFRQIEVKYNETAINNSMNNMNTTLTARMELLNSSVNLQLINSLNTWKNSTIDTYWTNITSYNEKGLQETIDNKFLNYSDSADTMFNSLKKEMITEQKVNQSLDNYRYMIYQDMQQTKTETENSTRILLVGFPILFVLMYYVMNKSINKAFVKKSKAPLLTDTEMENYTSEDLITSDEVKAKKKHILNLKYIIAKAPAPLDIKKKVLRDFMTIGAHWDKEDVLDAIEKEKTIKPISDEIDHDIKKEKFKKKVRQQKDSD